MTRREYREPAHLAMRKRLKREPELCANGCGRMATTLGHVPALALHAHVSSSGCCEVVAQCAECNYGEGARIGNARMRAKYAELRRIAESVEKPTFSRKW